VKVRSAGSQCRPGKTENQDAEPVIVSVDAEGRLFLNLGGEKQVLELAAIKASLR
ncbi:MAG: hypothetical protein IPG64_14885, partial [Haliea sp.]|nr:hypothetical protein [Haliea sp.]